MEEEEGLEVAQALVLEDQDLEADKTHSKFSMIASSPQRGNLF